jgi:isopenicillin N synthase-like dioxygenase
MCPLRSNEMLELGQRIFPLLALALEMEESFFDDKVGISDAE